MASKVSLSVNDVPIKLDYFVHGYLDQVVGGILASLHDTGEIKSLELSIDNEEQVSLRLNGADVPLKEFPIGIIRSTVLGMVAPLKGVGEVERLEITISR
jgi:hypothetical protein